MAIIKCPECGKEVSDRAPACVHCGFPLQGVQVETIIAEDAKENKTEVKEQEIIEEVQNPNKLVVHEETKEEIKTETPEEAAQRQKETIKQLKKSLRADRLMTLISLICLVGIIALAAHIWKSMYHGDLFFVLVIVLFIGLLPLMFFILAVTDIPKCRDKLEAAKYDISAYDKVVARQKKEAEEREQEQERIKKAMQEHEEAVKAAQHPKCPMCGSTNTVRISTINRATSVAMVGLASSKIGKQYQCNNCKHKW